MANESFDFVVGGIEDGIIGLLQSALLLPPPQGAGYLKQIASYGGELDAQTLRKFIDELAPQFPLMLVAYGDGDDKEMPATAPVFGEPRIFRHDCTFSVFCCTSDARGDQAQRRGAAAGVGVYQMLADVREAVAGYQFRRENAAHDMVLLNFEPLKPAGVEYVARLPGLTAYVQHFDTYFKWTEPDRRAVGTVVQNLFFDVVPLNLESGPGSLPGVTSE